MAIAKDLGGRFESAQDGEQNLIECFPLDATAARWMDELILRYSDQNIQLADASLLYVAEKEQIDCVFTLDRRDFSVVRLAKDRVLRIVPEI